MTGSAADVRLFCFPYSVVALRSTTVGRVTSVPSKRAWSNHPARGNRLREAHYGTYEDLADELADSLTSCLDGPFALFGHCCGALPAVELTARLAERGMPTPTHLFLSSQVAPQDGPYGRFLELDDRGLQQEMRNFVVAAGGTCNESLLQFGGEILRSDIEANKEVSMIDRADPAVRHHHRLLVGDREVPGSLVGGWVDCAENVRHVELDGEHYDFFGAPASLQQ